MNSTKVLKYTNVEHISSNFMAPAVFKITRFPKPVVKSPYPPKPFPLKVTHVANPPKMYQNEEEKVRKPLQNKENLNVNKPFAKKMQKNPTPVETGITLQRKVTKLIKLEPEVKLKGVELKKQCSSEDLYTEERVALEDEYGLTRDDLFQIDETDNFEAQSMDVENYENLNVPQHTEQESSTNVNGEAAEGCSGLKKGIDNDAIIADISTMDGLSMYEDIIEGTQKKLWEDEDYENLDIFFTENKQKSEANDNLTHFDWNISKAHDEDFEEEKVQKSVNKTPSEKFPFQVDFKDEDYEGEFDHLFYDAPMLEDSVPLFKKQSYKQERGLSLFEEEVKLFREDLSNRFDYEDCRNRSLSKITVDDWYKKDWRNHALTENSGASAAENECANMEIDEPEYFKRFDSILLGHDEVKDIPTPTIYDENINHDCYTEPLMNEMSKPNKVDSEDDFCQNNRSSHVSEMDVDPATEGKEESDDLQLFNHLPEPLSF